MKRIYPPRRFNLGIAFDVNKAAERRDSMRELTVVILFLLQIVVVAYAKEIHSMFLTFIGMVTATYFFFQVLKQS